MRRTKNLSLILLLSWICVVALSKIGWNENSDADKCDDGDVEDDNDINNENYVFCSYSISLFLLSVSVQMIVHVFSAGSRAHFCAMYGYVWVYGYMCRFVALYKKIAVNESRTSMFTCQNPHIHTHSHKHIIIIIILILTVLYWITFCLQNIGR